MAARGRRTLQPPFQRKGPGLASGSGRPRPWPRFRDRSIDHGRELRCNSHVRLRLESRTTGSDRCLWRSWAAACAFARATWHIREAVLVQRLFEPGYFAFLLLFAAEPRRMLPWRKIWTTGDSLGVCSRLW